jgi:hypothetical protein
MPHRAWRIRRGAFEAAPTDRLTAERLASFLSFLGSVSPASSKQVEAPEAPSQTPVAEPTPPDATSKTTGEPAPVTARPVTAQPVRAPIVVPPTVDGPSVTARPRLAPIVVPPTVDRPPDHPVSDGAVSDGAVSDVAVSDVAVSIPAATEETTSATSAAGRHRAPSLPRWTIRGFALTSRRLQMLGALAVFLAAAVVYLLVA